MAAHADDLRHPRCCTTLTPASDDDTARNDGRVWQVSWLTADPAEPSQPFSGQWHISAILTAYSCGGSHGIAPFLGGRTAFPFNPVQNCRNENHARSVSRRTPLSIVP